MYDMSPRFKGDLLKYHSLGAGNGKQHPFSLTLEHFTELLDTYRLPRAFVQTIHSNNGSLGYFIDYSATTSNKRPSSLCMSLPLAQLLKGNGE